MEKQGNNTYLETEPLPEMDEGIMKSDKQPPDHFSDFAEFYPYYLSQHEDTTCRRLHFVGTSLVILLFIYGVITLEPVWFLLMPLAGYGFAWTGHFFYEKNKPATFQYPWWSLMGDFKMFQEILIGKVRW
ncbi:DUF962 domain-containing protein [Hahella ganghwensis]|uniref:DUF962 domain-containing protein n=1 Tax=Hahella ganghwensis TaxID=286420 RepID=UPI0003786E5F|nr:DUF962 domain-containing protein [Hahella ganghwensis]